MATQPTPDPDPSSFQPCKCVCHWEAETAKWKAQLAKIQFAELARELVRRDEIPELVREAGNRLN